MKNLILMALSVALLNACSLNGSDDKSDTTSVPSDAEVTYEVTFTAVWNATNFETNFPSNAHFSPLIGVTHNENVSFWKSGSLATAGIKSVAETGATSSFETEINNAITEKTANYLIKGSGLGSGVGSISQQFGMTESHSKLTLVTMIAPSPDWIIGVSGLELYNSQTNSWEDKTIQLKVYDAGTDSGTTFTSANSVTEPSAAIALLTTTDESATDFSAGVHRSTEQHIGTFTITRVE